MAYRVTPLARADIAAILRESRRMWGSEAHARYSALILAALDLVGEAPLLPVSVDRGDTRPGLRTLHLRFVKVKVEAKPDVRRPAHVLAYRVDKPGIVEIVRVLHERMDFERRLADR